MCKWKREILEWGLELWANIAGPVLSVTGALGTWCGVREGLNNGVGEEALSNEEEKAWRAECVMSECGKKA